MSELKNKKPFGYNNDTEKEIIQFIFQTPTKTTR